MLFRSTLMNETITRAAGASHGQETSPELMEELIRSLGRTPRQRTTDYGEASNLQVQKSFGAKTLVEPIYTSAKKYERKQNSHKKELYRPGLAKPGSALPGSDDADVISSADII